MKHTIIDLFSGAGGMTLGFVDKQFGGNFKSVLAIDNDPAATKTYARNFGTHVICGDIEDWLVTQDDIPEADVVIGGPPCQGFSLLNKNRAGDSRRALWMPFLDVVERAKAKVFVIENVPGLLKSAEYDAIVDRAKSMGFRTACDILIAANYGAPQLRKRAVILGWRGLGNFTPTFPPLRTNRPENEPGNLPIWQTVRNAISDLPVPKGTDIRTNEGPLNLHFGRNPTPLSISRYKNVPPGGNRFDLQRNAPELTPGCWIRKKSGGTDLFGRLWWDRPSVTIRTEFFKPEKGRYLHPEQHRPITHREAARLMGFPDDFEFIGSKIEIARQIGNAVPPQLASAIASVVAELLDAKKVSRAA